MFYLLGLKKPNTVIQRNELVESIAKLILHIISMIILQPVSKGIYLGDDH